MKAPMKANFHNIIKEIENLLSAYRNTDEIPAIERDLAMEKIRSLYELLIRTAVSSPAHSREFAGETVGDITPGREKSSEVPPKKKPAEEKEKEPEETPEKEKTEEKKPLEEKQEEEEPEEEKQEKKPEPEVKEVLAGPAGDKKEEDKKEESARNPKIIAEKYQDQTRYINETISGQKKEENISSKLKTTPIENIRSAIGINDKFKFIHELFNGDSDTFNKTIEALDNSTNFNEAFNLINNHFDWDMEDDSVQMLLDLVRRKFIVNKNV